MTTSINEYPFIFVSNQIAIAIGTATSITLLCVIVAIYYKSHREYQYHGRIFNHIVLFVVFQFMYFVIKIPGTFDLTFQKYIHCKQMQPISYVFWLISSIGANGILFVILKELNGNNVKKILFYVIYFIASIIIYLYGDGTVKIYHNEMQQCHNNVPEIILYVEAMFTLSISISLLKDIYDKIKLDPDINNKHTIIQMLKYLIFSILITVFITIFYAFLHKLELFAIIQMPMQMILICCMFRNDSIIQYIEEKRDSNIESSGEESFDLSEDSLESHIESETNNHLIEEEWEKISATL